MTDKEKLEKMKKLADAMYYAAFNLTTDASLLRKAMKEYHQFIIHEYYKKEPVSIDFEQELYKAFGQVQDFTLGMQIAKWFYDMGKQQQEPVSDDLEKAAEEYATSVDFAGNKTIVGNEVDAFKAGANWQKEKNESTTEDLGEYINELSKQFPEVSFAKLSRIAVRVAKWQMAQMIKDATDVTVHVDAGGYPYVQRTIELYDYDKDVPLAKEGDKYKVVLIKEG